MPKHQHVINNATKETISKKQKIDHSYKKCRKQVADICLEVDRKQHQKLQQHRGKDFSTLNNLEALIQQYANLKYSMEEKNSAGDTLFAIALLDDDWEMTNILVAHGADPYIPQEKYPLDETEIIVGSLTFINDQNNDQELIAIPQTTNPDNTTIATTTDNILLNPEEDNRIIEETSTINRTDNSSSNQYDLSNDFNIYTLHQLAAKYSLQKIVQFCLNNEINLDAKDKEGYALLHILAQEGDYQSIRRLTLKVPDIDIQDLNNYTPLHWATVNKHYEATATLVAIGANINVQNINDQTPVHMAAITGDIGLTALLLQYVVPDLSIRDKCGYTPIDWAIAGQYDQLAKLLIKEAEYLNNLPPNTTTELHLAIAKGNIELITLLLKNGAKVDAQDSNGKTPLHLAGELLPKEGEKWIEIIKLLLKERANPEIRDQENITFTDIINAKSNSTHSGDNTNSAKEILNILQQSTSNSCLMSPVQEMPELPIAIPVSGVAKSATTKDIQLNELNAIAIVNSGEFRAQSDGAKPICNRQAGSNDATNFSSIDYISANYNNSPIFMNMGQDNINHESKVAAISPKYKPIITNVYSLAGSTLPRQEGKLDKVKKAFDKLEQKWRAAKEEYTLERSSFEVVSTSCKKQSEYIGAFYTNNVMFKFLQAIAHDLASNSQEFNKTLKALNNMVYAKSPITDFIDIGKVIFCKAAQGHYNIKENIKFLLQCIPLTEIANICQYANAQEIVRAIKISVNFSNKTLSLLLPARSGLHKSIEADRAVEECLNQWKQELKTVIFRQVSEDFISKVQSYCQKFVANVNLPNTTDVVTTITVPNAEINHEEEEVIDVMNCSPQPSNTQPNYYSAPLGETSIALQGNISSQNNIDNLNST